VSSSTTIWDRKKPSFGFLSTRFAGTDGVSLEAQKWVDVIRNNGCESYFMAGMLDTPEDRSYLAPQAFFHHPDIVEVQEALFARKERTPAIGKRIEELKELLKSEIYAFHKKFQFDVLVPQNALAIPVNIPLGLAIAEFIYETEIPTIAHNHDFYWERQRFRSHAVMDYFRKAFPPVHPCIQHVVINSIAGEELARRTGERWTLVPNVLNFSNEAAGIDDYTRDFRKEVGIDEDALFVLQPTRVVQRKGIETAVEVVKRLEHPKPVLVISHEAGDEGMEYQERVKSFADFLGVDLRIIADRISETRGLNAEGKKTYTLWDIYPHCDLVTYPSTYEGYGNAFVEAIYFRKPVVVNRYSIFEADIEPKGFNVVALAGYVTDEAMAEVHAILSDAERQARMAEANYMLGWRYLSYEMLEEQLEMLLVNVFGS